MTKYLKLYFLKIVLILKK